MGVYSRVSSWFGLGAPSQRSTLLPDLLGASYGAATSTEDGALRVAAVYACVRVIAETIGTLPLLTYRRMADGGKQRAEGEPIYTLLRQAPNTEQTSVEWREQMVAHLLLRGNAYSRIVRDARGTPVELWPLSPEAVTPRVNAGGAIVGYDVRGLPAVAPSDMLHVRGLSTDGVLGRSVLRDAQDTFAAANSAQQFSRRVFDNDATPGMVIKHPETLDEEAAKRLRESWERMYAGPRNAGRVAVLEEGMSLDRVQLDPEALQFLETRKLQRQEIAAIFRVPPHLIGDLSQSSFSNIEQQSIEFVTYCLRPWCVRIEQALWKRLLTPAQRRDLFFEFLIDGLVRGDIQSRYNSYMVGRQAGFLSVNDIRALENLNPIAGGDRYLEPLNMQSVTDAVSSGVASVRASVDELRTQIALAPAAAPTVPAPVVTLATPHPAAPVSVSMPDVVLRAPERRVTKFAVMRSPDGLIEGIEAVQDVDPEPYTVTREASWRVTPVSEDE